jgi:hypothetical protein
MRVPAMPRSRSGDLGIVLLFLHHRYLGKLEVLLCNRVDQLAFGVLA